MSQGSKFDFQKFLRRALDEDFVVVVGIRCISIESMVPFGLRISITLHSDYL